MKKNKLNIDKEFDAKGFNSDFIKNNIEKRKRINFYEKQYLNKLNEIANRKEIKWRKINHIYNDISQIFIDLINYLLNNLKLLKNKKNRNKFKNNIILNAFHYSAILILIGIFCILLV